MSTRFAPDQCLAIFFNKFCNAGSGTGRNPVNHMNPTSPLPAKPTIARTITAIFVATFILVALAGTPRLDARDLTVERVDGYDDYNELWGYTVVSTMGVLRRSGQFVPFSDQSGAGGWMPGGFDAPALYPRGTFWTFARFADLGTLRTAFPWFDFRWPEWQSTGGSGIIQVFRRGNGTVAGNTTTHFGSGTARWRTRSGGSLVKLGIPEITFTEAGTDAARDSGALRVALALSTSSSVYHGTSGKIVAMAPLAPLASTFHYPPHSRVQRMRRPPKGRLRSAMHLMEYTDASRYERADTRRFGNTVRFR